MCIRDSDYAVAQREVFAAAIHNTFSRSDLFSSSLPDDVDSDGAWVITITSRDRIAYEE